MLSVKGFLGVDGREPALADFRMSAAGAGVEVEMQTGLVGWATQAPSSSCVLPSSMSVDDLSSPVGQAWWLQSCLPLDLRTPPGGSLSASKI